MAGLLVAPCGYEAAKFAVMNWHYSAAMPPPRRVMFGVWEDATFKGCVIFSRGASASLGTAYGLSATQVCELTRVALREHDAPVSSIVAVALGALKRSAPGLRLVISFADPYHGHHGGIYQAGNWLYLGLTGGQTVFVVHGQVRHSRSMGGVQFGSGRRTRQSLAYLREHIDPGAQQMKLPGKHRYAMPFDRGMRRQLVKRALPYPAAEASTATRSASGGEGPVRPRPAARIKLVSLLTEHEQRRAAMIAEWGKPERVPAPADGLIAWRYRDRAAAEAWQASTLTFYGHPSLSITDQDDGTAIGITDLRPALTRAARDSK